MNKCTSLAVFGTDQSFTLATFSGLGETPLADRICPRKFTLV